DGVGAVDDAETGVEHVATPEYGAGREVLLGQRRRDGRRGAATISMSISDVAGASEAVTSLARSCLAEAGSHPTVCRRSCPGMSGAEPAFSWTWDSAPSRGTPDTLSSHGSR